ncbi:histidine phosphatase family protein [Paenibacillus sp. OV219]|uniref:histidine phosphatase family protein n=1 Tax=Paenibacillus sp. OV219 TaxID=1884377 RepID=UPI0008ADBAB4|nr:histidine phosphatase family protein [Paenibacillus sp. OV219]SEP14601.1 Broad specificity phosphatase PhoE [Paenibacillus sp. OV219]
MSMRIYIVRHAQPADQEPNYPGHPNSPLGQRGLAQAAFAGEQFANWGRLDAIYSSSLQRAMQTAEAIYKKQPEVPWHVWPILCETDRRGWPAMRQLELEGTYTAHVDNAAAIREAQGENYPRLSKLGDVYQGAQASQMFDWPDVWQGRLEADTREKTYERARLSIEALRKTYEGDDARIAVVCHAAFGSVFLNVLMGCEPCDHNRFAFSHASIARVDVEDDGAVSLQMVNYVGHLPQDMITEGIEDL